MAKMLRIWMLLSVLIVCGFSSAAGQNLESEMQSVLQKTGLFVTQLRQKIESGENASGEDVTRFKGFAEKITVNHLLLTARFEQRQERALSFGVKALDRHQEMMKDYLMSIDAILNRLNSLQDAQDITATFLEYLKTDLDGLLPKKKIPFSATCPTEA